MAKTTQKTSHSKKKPNPGYIPRAASKLMKQGARPFGAPPKKSTPAAAKPKTKGKGVMAGRPVAVPKPKPQVEGPSTVTANDLNAAARESIGLTAQEVASGTYLDYPLLADLPDLLTRQQTLKSRLAQLEPLIAEEKEVRENIEALLIAADVPATTTPAGTTINKVTVGPYVVARYEVPGALVLDETKLLANGVDADIISASKTQQASYSYARVQTPKTKANQKGADREDREDLESEIA